MNLARAFAALFPIACYAAGTYLATRLRRNR